MTKTVCSENMLKTAQEELNSVQNADWMSPSPLTTLTFADIQARALLVIAQELKQLNTILEGELEGKS